MRYGKLLIYLGEARKGEEELLRAEEIDPSIAWNTELAISYNFARQPDKALDRARKALEIDPNAWIAYEAMGDAYYQKKMPKEASAAYEEAAARAGDSVNRLDMLGQAYAIAGKRAEAEQILAEMNEPARRLQFWPTDIACVYSLMGDKEQAFAWLDKACREHDPQLRAALIDPWWDNLRSDARFGEVLQRVNLAPKAQATPAAKKVAVLPFRTFDRKGPGDEYLQLGLADALITKLSNLKRVLVRPTSAVRKYNGVDHDALAAGRELQVDAILDGSVQRSGDRTRITVQLVDTQDGASLWAEQFDGSFSDILSLEDAISNRVAQALALRLTADEQTRLTKRYTADPEAYDLYLKGRYNFNKRLPDSFPKAIQFFNRALAKDPNFALPYVGLADAYLLLTLYNQDLDSIPKAKEAVMKALAIDDSLAEAHTSLAQMKEMIEWDWAGAEREYARALELNPNYATAHHWYGTFLMSRGRASEAERELRAAQELDPLSLTINSALADHYYFAREYDKAISQVRKTLEIEATPGGEGLLASIYVQKGMLQEAIAIDRKVLSELPDNVISLGSLGYSYGVLGQREKAEEVLRHCEQLAQDRYIPPVTLAVIYTGLGDKDQAFTYLTKAVEAKDPILGATIQVEPRFNSLRSDPRYTDLLRRMKLLQ
jgi:TolB-like protein/Tfp pilus assembly protein PilF